jgi:hypothetical protein
MDASVVCEATGWQLAGAGCFGGVIGWLVYALQRHRQGPPTVRDLIALIGAIGGTAVLALFPARSELFGAYGIGLAAGFFLYFAVLVVLAAISPNYGVDWFLDGRRKRPSDGWYIPSRKEQARQVPPPMDDAARAQRTGNREA